jgi:nitrous oxide reductase accessory protein NosL
MINFLKSGILEEKEISQRVVINFEKENDFIDVEQATFWVNPQLRSPMGSNAAAFSSKEAAEKANSVKEGTLHTWEELFKSQQ